MAGKFESLTLGDVVTLQRGTTYKSALLGQPGPVLLGLASIKRNGGFRDDNLKTYGGESPAKLLLRPGDVFVSLKDVTQSADLLGAVARVPLKISSGRVTQDTVKLTFTRKDIPASYVYWLLRTPRYREYCRAHAIGTTNLSIARDDFLAYPVARPSAQDMTLVRTLDALDDKIELNRKMNEKLEQMAQALFKSWFVDFDPVHAKAAGRQPAGMDKATADLFPDSFVDSELGKVPKGWRIGTISEIATNPKRGIQPGDIAPGTPYIGLEHMPRRSIALGDWADSNVVESGKTVFKKGEVLFGKLRPYFHKVGLAQVDGVCSTDILVLSPISENWRGSLLCIASSDELIQFTNLASTGTKMPRTNWRDVGSFKIVMPCNGVAEEFTKQTTSLTDKIGQNLAESKILTETRDVLLPKLLSRR